MSTTTRITTNDLGHLTSYEISRIRRLISRVQSDLDNLSSEERTQISHAVAVLRQHRTVALGMPRVRLTPSDMRPAA